jgi:hypothetical protein
MSASLNQFDFISDPRDGKNFDIVKNLQAAVLLGSELAKEILGGLEYQVNNPDFSIPHSRIEADVNGFKERWEAIRAFEEDGDGDEEDIEDQDELWVETSYWLETLGFIGPESYRYIFSEYINYEGYGAFGQGNSFNLDKEFWELITNPSMPRDLLWDLSVGDSAARVADPDESGHIYWYPLRDLLGAPRYVNHLAISPVASTNLLKEINKKYEDTLSPNPFHLHTLLNVNADINLLKDLDPESVRDNLVYEVKLLQGDDWLYEAEVLPEPDWRNASFNEEFVEKYEWILKPYFATARGKIEYEEAKEAVENDFSKPSGIGALLIATRMSEEFKAGIVNIDDHLDSDSEILRTLLYYNPDLQIAQKESLKKLGIIDLDNDIAELYKNAWNPANPTLVM